jgi:hypothetical protein
MSDSISHARDQAKFRTFTLALCGVLTLAWVWLTIGGITDTLPFERGYGNIAAALATIVFVVFVLPALALAYFNRLIGVAFTLAVLGLVCYAYGPVLRLFALLGI